MRVLSLHPAATELVFAIGAASALVGRTDRCDYPEGASKIPTLGDPADASLPVVAVFEPDLILTGKGQDKLAAALSQEYRIFTLAPKSAEELFRQILSLAEILGKQIEAEVVVHDLMATLERIKGKAAKFRRVRVYFEVAHSPLTAATCYLDDILMLAGGQPYRGEVTLEKLREFDPQIIIVSAPGEGTAFSEEILLARDGWQDLNAVRYERVFILDDTLFFRPGPRLVEGVRLLARILHGVDAGNGK